MNYITGRGAQLNTPNKFHKHQKEVMHIEAIDEWVEADPKTILLEDLSTTIVNRVDSPDVGMVYSVNPYKGCEHGCIYCFARNSFEYWGYSAGLDFETKIIVKKNAAALLHKFLMNPRYQCEPLSLSGNTDCYQPIERKLRITRSILEVCRQFNQPVSLITKNSGMLRDIDILGPMGRKNQASIMVSITSLNEDLRLVMEPRTTTAKQRLRLIEEASRAGIKTGVMIGPVIPGLNDHEIHDILVAAAKAGAVYASYTFIRLNGALGILFQDWLHKNFPDRADKVLNMIKASHSGKLNDSRFGVRMRGEGNVAEMVEAQFMAYRKKYGLTERFQLDCTAFQRPGTQMSLF